jgi:hypothetical protein
MDLPNVGGCLCVGGVDSNRMASLVRREVLHVVSNINYRVCSKCLPLPCAAQYCLHIPHQQPTKQMGGQTLHWVGAAANWVVHLFFDLAPNVRSLETLSVAAAVTLIVATVAMATRVLWRSNHRLEAAAPIVHD